MPARDLPDIALVAYWRAHRARWIRETTQARAPIRARRAALAVESELAESADPTCVAAKAALASLELSEAGMPGDPLADPVHRQALRDAWLAIVAAREANQELTALDAELATINVALSSSGQDTIPAECLEFRAEINRRGLDQSAATEGRVVAREVARGRPR